MKKKEIKSRFYADFEEMRKKSITKRALKRNNPDLRFCKGIILFRFYLSEHPLKIVWKDHPTKRKLIIFTFCLTYCSNGCEREKQGIEIVPFELCFIAFISGIVKLFKIILELFIQSINQVFK